MVVHSCTLCVLGVVYVEAWVCFSILCVSAPDPLPVLESSQSLSGGAIAGIVIGTIAGVGLIGGGSFFAYKKLH